LRLAVRLDPTHADAHYNLALVCDKLDEPAAIGSRTSTSIPPLPGASTPATASPPPIRSLRKLAFGDSLVGAGLAPPGVNVAQRNREETVPTSNPPPFRYTKFTLCLLIACWTAP
jgi:hypothetical protein